MKIRIVISIIVLPFLILAYLPILLWNMKDSTALNVSVVDKTVPQSDYREHLGLFWMLTHRKIVKETGDLYILEDDYYGYKPSLEEGDIEFPIKEDIDLLYIADTYGIYEADLYENYRGERSQLLYGGLTIYDWNRIIESKEDDTTLIMEFNSIASPTEPLVRGIVENNMGFKWTGWIGRYFPDLEDTEIPIWLVHNYEQQYNETWNFEGEGIAFVDDSDQVVVLDQNDLDGNVLFQWKKEGKNHYPSAEDSSYNYWFDIVIPDEDYTVEAQYTIDLMDSGKEKLNDFNIPLEFPAVIYNSNKNTYYFAGDYADISADYMSKWLLPEAFYSVLAFFYPDDAFFWNSYIPMMKQILTEIEVNRENKERGD